MIVPIESNIPTNIDNNTTIFCFTAAISVVQFRFGNNRLATSPKQAENQTYRTGNASIKTAIILVGCTTIIALIQHNTTGTMVKHKCTFNFAHNTCHAATGKDCGIQIHFPSNVIDGAVMSFIPAMLHNPKHISKGIRFGSP